MPVSVTKSGPGPAALKRSLEQLRKSDVLVGVPASRAPRPKDAINNASLLFVLTNGSPLRNIPATPILEPAVEKAKVPIADELKIAAKAILDKDAQKAEVHLNRAGIVATNAAKRMFVDNDWPPNAPSTIARKGSDRRNIDTSSLRRAITHILRDK